MKTTKVILSFALFLFISGCVVYSFYPLYTEKDLFPNSLLLGKWIDDQETEWNFEYAYKGKKVPENVDSTSYILTQKYMDDEVPDSSEFSVHVIKLEEKYFLDFYMEEYTEDYLFLKDFHIIPVHTFAKLSVEENKLSIQWFDQEWLEDLLEKNRIRIHHENNGDFILLTAKPAELQKFVIKYADAEEAFKDGLKA
ncbi:MAG: hypothetical protein LC658_05055, partial [Bacteroidales bacterium]|nr:hypothetical protein [Bacteroidales bacterium]